MKIKHSTNRRIQRRTPGTRILKRTLFTRRILKRALHQEDPKRDHDPKKDPLMGGPRRTPDIGALGEVLKSRKQGEDLARHPLGSQGLATLVNIKQAKGSYNKEKKIYIYSNNNNKSRATTKSSSQKGS